jgi:hypothetical protein
MLALAALRGNAILAQKFAIKGALELCSVVRAAPITSIAAFKSGSAASWPTTSHPESAETIRVLWYPASSSAPRSFFVQVGSAQDDSLLTNSKHGKEGGNQ